MASAKPDVPVDQQDLPPEEARIARLYGRPLNPVDRFRKAKPRQFFDSGDYAVAQSGKRGVATPGALGHEHPSPETIPHPAQSPVPSNSAVVGGGATPGLPKAHNSGPLVQTQPQVTEVDASSTVALTGSPVKETSSLSHETSVDDEEKSAAELAATKSNEKTVDSAAELSS